MISRLAFLAAFAAALLVGGLPGKGPSPFSVSYASAAPAEMFLKMAGIEGESTDRQHAKEMDVLTWSWGLSNTGSARTGGGGGAGRVNMQDLSFTKTIDKATPQLMLAVANGKQLLEAVLTVRRSGETPVEYLVITMQDVIITSYATAANGGEQRLTEIVTLNFAKVKVTYTPQSADGRPGSPVTFGWDFAQNRPF
jgi:type VI secretion system secreted protein Hcp